MRSSSLVLALVAALAITAGVLVTGVAQSGLPSSSSRAGRASPTVDAPVSTDAGALAVLRHWDAERSLAWSRGDVAALRAIYLPGSTAGARDVAMLRAWRSRGFRVHGLRMQVLRAEVRAQRHDRIVVRVLDRVARGWATRSHVRTRLPTGVARARTITLVRLDGGWRVAAVRLSPGPWPAPR